MKLSTHQLMAEYCKTQVGILQDFNMVKIEPRPQTTTYTDNLYLEITD